MLDKIELEEIVPSSRKYPFISFKAERELGPIRERRLEYAKDMGEVYNMLQKVVKKLEKLLGKHYQK